MQQTNIIQEGPASSESGVANESGSQQAVIVYLELGAMGAAAEAQGYGDGPGAQPSDTQRRSFENAGGTGQRPWKVEHHGATFYLQV